MNDGGLTSSRPRQLTAWALAGCALFLPISIAVSQPLGYLVAALGGWLWWREGLRPPLRSPYLWPIAAFAALAVLSAALGVRPSLSFAKLHRLLLLGMIFILPALGGAARDADRAWVHRLVLLFILGATLQASWDFVRMPLQYAREAKAYAELVASGAAPKGLHEPTIYDLGNMRDPQFYMVALCLIAGLLLYRRAGDPHRWLGLAAVINTVAWIAHFKRGSWFSLVIALLVVAVMSGRRWIILVVVALAAVVWPIPQVQQRVAALREELQLKQGGRYALWTRVAPALLREHPWGMGWRATKNEDFATHGVKVQKKLNHLHNNPMQVALETGWAGGAAWLCWMATALAVMWRGYRWARARDPAWAGTALGLFGGFLALMLNGMVEYNFGDGEIFMLMGFLMAVSGFIWTLRHRDPAASPPR